MKMLVGLGNPGKEYSFTRHNAGFIVIDLLCQKLKVNLDSEKFKALYLKTKINNEDLLIVKPLTYMNNSGIAVSELSNYYKISHQDIIVIHDDLDLPVGKLRLRPQGSSGGQKGMGSIINHLGTSEIKRIRLGIGKPQFMSVADYVLGKFAGEEKDIFMLSALKASEALLMSIDNPFTLVMNKFNI